MASVTFHPDARDTIAAIGVATWVRDAQPVVLAAMKAAAPIDTGHLRFTHIPRLPKRVGRGEWSIAFVALAGYSYLVHEGRGWVYPVRAKALRWVSKGGTVVFARSARPTSPNRWMPRAMRRVGLRNVREVHGPSPNTTAR